MSTPEAGFAQAPIDDELETEILPLRRRRRLPLLTALLVVAAIAAGAFAGGVEAQKHYGGGASSSSSSGRFAANGGTSAGSRRHSGAGGGAGGAFFGGGGVTAGLVTLIRGSTLYVTDFSGNTVKVSTRGARVTQTTTASLKSIHPGDSVVVRGAAQKNGSMRASAITLGAGALGGGNG